MPAYTCQGISKMVVLAYLIRDRFESIVHVTVKNNLTFLKATLL